MALFNNSILPLLHISCEPFLLLLLAWRSRNENRTWQKILYFDHRAAHIISFCNRAFRCNSNLILGTYKLLWKTYMKSTKKYTVVNKFYRHFSTQFYCEKLRLNDSNFNASTFRCIVDCAYSDPNKPSVSSFTTASTNDGGVPFYDVIVIGGWIIKLTILSEF